MSSLQSPICMTGTFALDPLRGALEDWNSRLGWNSSFELRPAVTAPCDLVACGLSGDDSKAVHFLVVRPSDWENFAIPDPMASLDISPVQAAAQTFSKSLLDQCNSAEHHVIVLLAPSTAGTSSEATEKVQQVENQLFAALSKNDHVHVCRSPRWMGANGANDPDQLPLFPALAMMTARCVQQIVQPAAKLLVVHAKNALWEGSPTAENEAPIKIVAAHREFQRTLAGQQESGVGLALLTDGPEHITRRVIREHPDMILKEDDILEIRRLEGAIDQEVDTLVNRFAIPAHQVVFFATDSTLVSALRKTRPEILSVILPGKAQDLPSFLEHLWILDRDLASKDMGKAEADHHLVEHKRRLLRQRSSSFASYLQTLKTKTTQVSPSGEYHERMAKLTSEANKLNATARRFTAAEIKTWLGRPYHYASLFRMEDIYGDHGVIGMIMFERVKRTLLVHNFLLDDSAADCGAEHSMLIELGAIAIQHNCLDIDLPFLRSNENDLTANFFAKTIGAYEQNLPEEGWSVFQIPIKFASSLRDISAPEPLPTTSQCTTECDADVYAPSEVIQQIADQWQSLAYDQPAPPETLTDPLPTAAPSSQDEPIHQEAVDSPFTVIDASPDKAIDRASRPPLPKGPFALSSIQSWFFHQEIEGRDHWNDAIMLQSNEGLDCAILEASLKAVADHHGAFRLHFHRKTGEWRQEYGEPSHHDLLRIVDLSRASDDGIQDQIETIAAATQGRLSLRQGALLRAVYFNLGSKRPARLLLVAHQLVVDRASWCILLDHLTHVYHSHLAGAPGALPDEETSSYSQWVTDIARAHDAARADYIATLPDSKDALVGIAPDFDNPGRNIEGSREILERTLSKDDTDALIGDSASVEAYILGTLSHALQKLGAQPTLADWIWSGRSTAPGLERTVGWFDQRAPVCLDPSRSPNATTAHLSKQLAQLRDMQGLGDAGLSLPTAWISYRHLQSLAEIIGTQGLFKPAPEAVGALHSPRALRTHPVSLESRIENGQLILSWSYSRHWHHRETIENLANQQFEQLASTCGELQNAMAATDPDLAVTQRIVASPFTVVATGESPLEVNVPRHQKPTPPRSNRVAESQLARKEALRLEQARLDQERAAQEEQARLDQDAVVPIHRPVLLVVSANSPEALNAERAILSEQLGHQSDEDLSEVAIILATSKHSDAYRSTLLMQSRESVKQILETPASPENAAKQQPVIFAFPDTWAGHPSMGRGLYQTEKAFREVIDWCGTAHQQLTGHDLRETLFNSESRNQQKAYADAALFSFEFALARLLMSWGIYPDSCFGQGTGEFVAACLGGVFTLEEGLALIAKRSEIIEKCCPSGRILKVMAPAVEVKSFLKQQVDVAAYQSPNVTLVAGPADDIEALTQVLTAQRIAFEAPVIDRPRHSRLMRPLEAPFTMVLDHVDLRPTQIPFISGATGGWIMDESASNIEHWVSQLSTPQLVSEGFQNLGDAFSGIVIEVGPASTLADSLKDSAISGLVGLPGVPAGPQAEVDHLAKTVGRLWEEGTPVDWHAYHAIESPTLEEIPEAHPEPMLDENVEVNQTPVLAIEPLSLTADEPVIESLEPLADEFPNTPIAESEPIAEGAQAAARLLLVSDEAPESVAVNETSAPVIDFPTDAVAEEDLLDLADFTNITPFSAPAKDAIEETPLQPSEAPLIDAGDLHRRFETIESALDDLRATLFPSAQIDPLAEDAPLPEGIAAFMEEQGERLRQRTPQTQRLLTDWASLSGASANERPEILPHRQMGGQIWDADDHNYVDFTASIRSHWLGYRAPEIVRAFRQYLLSDTGPESVHQLQTEVGQAILGLSQADHVQFTPSSAEAMGLAFLLATKRSGRPAIGLIKRDSGPSIGHLLRLSTNEEQLQTQILRRRHELAAIVLNPLQLIHLSAEERIQFIVTLRLATQRWEIALIFDERDTAFRWSGDEHRQSLPDLSVYGECLADGIPLGIVAGSADWFESGRIDEDVAEAIVNPLPLVAARATLKTIGQAESTRKPSWIERTSLLVKGLGMIADELEAPISLHRLGSLFTLELSCTADEARLLETETLFHGVRLSVTEANTTTLAHTEEDLARVHTAFLESIHTLQDRGFLLLDLEAYQTRLARKKDENLLKFWQTHLHGACANWPTDYAPSSSSNRQSLHRALDPSLHQALTDQARTLGDTSETLYTACFQRLFQTWANTNRIAFRTEIEGLSAVFCTGTSSLTIREAIVQVNDAKALAKENALFQQEVFDAWLDEHGPSCGFGFDLTHRPEKLPLHWSVTPDAIICDFESSLYDEDTIVRWMDCFFVLLEGFASKHSETPINQLPLISGDVFETLVERRNLTTTGDLPKALLHQLFEAVAAKTPNRIAVRHGKDKVYYGDLNTRADQLAAALLEQGVKPEEAVAVLAEPSPHMLEAWLAVLKIGAVYLPIDPQHRSQPDYLQKAGVNVILSDQSESDVEPWCSGAIRVLDIEKLIRGSQQDHLTRLASPITSIESPAVILFDWESDDAEPTFLPHRALVRLVKNTDYATLSPHEVFLLGGSPCSDRCLLEVWGPLLNGGVLAIPQGLRSTELLAETIGRHRVSSLVLTGEELTSLMERHAEDLSWIRQILITGQRPSPEIITRILEELPVSLTIGYGSIKNAFLTCCHTLSIDEATRDEVRLGLPIPHTQVYLLNEAHQPVPVGMEGTVWVGGHGVALFANSGERDDVIASPFKPSRGLLFCTHDRAVWDKDGVLVRADSKRSPTERSAKQIFKVTSLWNESSGCPVVFLAVGSAEKALCQGIAAHALSDHPTHIIEIDLSQPHARSVEVIAAECLEQIRSLAGDKSMVVGGGPLGGIVTYEVGQQAFESEGAFDLLALIDTRNPAAESDDDMDDLHPTLLRYAPRAYQGPVTLFRRSAQARLHQLGWDGLVRGGMTVIQTEDMEDLAMKFRSVVTQQPNTFELS